MILQKTIQKWYLLLVLCFFYGCVPIEQQGRSTSGTGTTEYYSDQTLRYQDYIYDPEIHSVQCYLATGHAEEILTPPIGPITQAQPIMLEFDKLYSEQERYRVKLVHCNANWTPSALTDMQFLYDYNEFFITDVEVSGNTKVLYHHYRFKVPRVKLSGNYLIVVQNEGGGLALTQRMMLYENQVAVQAQSGMVTGVTERFTNQQINFAIFYGKYQLIQPWQEVKVVIRQNYRWDNAIVGLRPTSVREDLRKLEYEYFNFENNFPGLSEFRVFDTRSLRYTGYQVAKILPDQTPTEVLLQPDRSRRGQAYSQDPDANGRRFFGNREFGLPDINADYAWVNFFLQVKEPAPGTVYVFGELSNWNLRDDFKLKYNPESKAYTGKALLKQGYYNYVYAVKPSAAATQPDIIYFEGSHNQTENIYDILVYYRPPGTRADLLIAYEELFVNERK